MARTTLHRRGHSADDDSTRFSDRPRAPSSSGLSKGGGSTLQKSSNRAGMGDLSAGPRRRNSLSEKGLLPRLCCVAPALNLFFFYGVVLVSSLTCSSLFYALTATLTFITMLWISNLAFSSAIGAFRMRQTSQIDWHSKLEDLQKSDPTNTDVMQIVILPNYRENEQMLKQTLENLGSAPAARETMHVVLAMEAREGPVGREKADRLIAETSHLFADVMFTSHPDKLPGEVPGKSSNTQWGYREALRKYSPTLQKRDLTRVFLTIGDADTLWHPQYFSAMAYQGLMMPSEERFWKMWQPPILLMRNFWSVPGVTRASAIASLIFELAGLANQVMFPAFCFSAYSLTLALASHPEVDGWDVDVIAEDHHMFCKCYFAALWEQHHGNKFLKHHSQEQECMAIVPHVEVQPVFLPAVSYLVESSGGYRASCVARFQQARRHMQGVVELGYTLLQYSRLVRQAGFSELPFRTHTAIWSIMFKMQTLHITSTCQCFALIMAAVTSLAPGIVQWLWSGGLFAALTSTQSFVTLAFDGWTALDLAQQALAASFGQISGVVGLYSFIAFLVMVDLFEGRYYCLEAIKSKESTAKTSPDSEALNSFVVGPLGWLQRTWIFVRVISDTALVGYTTMAVYCMIPVVLASWSLIRRGAEFEYIVAVKPE